MTKQEQTKYLSEIFKNGIIPSRIPDLITKNGIDPKLIEGMLEKKRQITQKKKQKIKQQHKQQN